MLTSPAWIKFFLFLSCGSLLYVLLTRTIDLFRLIAAAIGLRRYVHSLKYTDYNRYVDSDNMAPISLLVPVCNGSAAVVDSVRRLLSLDFPLYEVIVVNDGSGDDTLRLLIDAFDLIPFDQPYKKTLETAAVKRIYRSMQNARLIVADKAHGGSADALNAGINIASYPVFVSVDADAILEESTLKRIIYTFISDPSCVAVGGMARIDDGRLSDAQPSNKPILALQTAESLRAFFTERAGWGTRGMPLTLPGAFGAFDKRAVIAAGGYRRGCIGADTELIVRLHKRLRAENRPYSIRILPDPICRTQPCGSFADLIKQRMRRQAGLIDALVRHRDMLLHPRYGRIGMLCVPYYWMFELLGPVIETLGGLSVLAAFLLGVIDLRFLLAFFLVAALYGAVLSTLALLLEENTFQKQSDVKRLFRLFLYALIDNFGFRQINTLCMAGALLGFRGKDGKRK